MTNSFLPTDKFGSQVAELIERLPQGASDILIRLALNEVYSFSQSLVAIYGGQKFPVIIERPTTYCPAGWFRLSYGLGNLELLESGSFFPSGVDLDAAIREIAPRVPADVSFADLVIYSTLFTGVEQLRYEVAPGKAFSVSFEKPKKDHLAGDIGLYFLGGQVYYNNKSDTELQFTPPSYFNGRKLEEVVLSMLRRLSMDSSLVRIVVQRYGLGGITGGKLTIDSHSYDVDFLEPQTPEWDGTVVLKYKTINSDPRASC